MMRATLKGHGNPTQLISYGAEAKPRAQGVLVTVVKTRGGADLVDETGRWTTGWVASARKFWAEPVAGA